LLGKLVSGNFSKLQNNTDMGLPKGSTNNPGGRPKGSVNKVGAELRERITAFIEDRWETLEEDFELLDPKDRLHFLEKLLAYALPKLQTVKHEGELPGGGVKTLRMVKTYTNGAEADNSEGAGHIIIIEDMSKLPGEKERPQGEGYL
jgi:hypothetical protein